MIPDLSDTSTIPDEPAYWDALAARVTARATRRGFASFAASRSGWIAAAVLVAAALALAALPRAATRSMRGAQWVLALAPSDRLGRSLAWRERPPAIGGLLLGDQSAGGEP
jgi:hypothetical protein